METYQIINDKTIIRHVIHVASGNEMKEMPHSDKPILEDSYDYYIVWDDEQIPIIKCKGKDILENWDDVIAVTFDTCFVDCKTEQGFLIRG